MRVLRVVIDGYKSIEDQTVRLSGLVVLFGPNSSGKTNVLDAVDYLLTGRGPARFDRLDQDAGETPDGSILFDLDGADIPGHPDRVLLDELHMEQHGGGSVFFVIDNRGSLAKGSSPSEMRSFLASELASGGDGASIDRELVANELVASTVLEADVLDTRLVALPSVLSSRGRDAAARLIDAARGDDDALAQSCETLLAGGWEYVESLGDGWGARSYAIVDAVWLRHEPAGLAADVVAAIEAADKALGCPTSAEGRTTRLTRMGIVLSNDLRGDRWLEEQIAPQSDVTEGEAEEDPWVEEGDLRPGDPASWFRVRPILSALADVLATRATELLPGFVRDLGVVAIQILPPTMWGGELGKIRVGLVEPSGHSRSLDSLGAATARWTSAAVRLACADLSAATWPDPDSANERVLPGEQVATEKREHHEVQRIDSGPTWPDRIREVFLVDEPEVNLHPAAVHSIIKWLSRLALRTNGVLVATHHPGFLSLGPDEAMLLRVSKAGGKTVLQPIPGGDLERLDGAAVELGISRAELLQHTRLVLFVEGPHDKIVLEAFIGDDLRRARVWVVPIHGTHNALALVDSELVARLGIPIAILTDNATGTGRSAEDADVARLVREATLEGRTVHRFGIKPHDILHYVHIDACREMAPAFPGWDVAAQEWKALGGFSKMTFKRFVTSTYGLELNRRSVARMADRTMELRGPPKAIVRIGKEISSVAADLRRPGWDPTT